MPDPKLGAGFFTPHDEAAAIVAGKPVVTRQVFDKLVPELRARAMVVTGVEGANTVQRIKDEIADYTRGQTDGGQARTWDDAKAAIAQTLEDEAFSPQAAERRATLLIRTHGFQAYQAANYRVAMEDDDTTHLQYLATEDSRVRDSHLALNGLILPKNDPFWDKHYPPWEWGCRCRVRPINPDMLDRQRAKDATRPPEDRLVIEGPALDRLRAGQIVRGELKDRDGRTVGMGAHDVTPPSQKLGADKAFQWHPRDLRMPLQQILDRYDPDVRDDFLANAKAANITPTATILDWLEGRALPTRPDSLAGIEGTARTARLQTVPDLPFSGGRKPRLSLDEAQAVINARPVVISESSSMVRFGPVIKGKLERTLAENPHDPRARYIESAKATVAKPVEIWEQNGRRYYIGRFQRRSGITGFVVVAARKGENVDEVISFFPKTDRELEDFRSGRLVYQRNAP